MFEILVQLNSSEVNKVDKNIETIYTIRGDLRESSSIIDPQILIGGMDMQKIKDGNYLTIPSFGRSYFIRNIESVNHSLILITAHVDVLSSFAASIRTNSAIVKRQQNSPIWNLYLNDGSLKAYQNPQVITKPFPQGFTTVELVLATAGR